MTENEGTEKDLTDKQVKDIGEESNDVTIMKESENIEVINESLVKTNETFNSPSKFSGSAPMVLDNFDLLERTAKHLASMNKVASELVKSGLCPLKNTSDVVLAIITGNQYNFPFMTSINNIYPVNGRPSMSAHLIRALVITNQISFQKIYNAEPLYMFAQTDENGNIIVLGEGKEKRPKAILGTGTAKDVIPNAKPILSKIIDRITKYSFKRMIKLGDGTWDTIVVTSEFKMSDAIQAGLADKDNWAKHPDRMLDARAFTIGAREIAPDKLLGIYSIGELAEVNNMKYTMDDSFTETIVQE